MFAVPGWNVSAPLATQTETAKPAPEGKKGKKRKRNTKEMPVNEENIGAYFDGTADTRKWQVKELESKETNGNVVDKGTGANAQKVSKKRKRKGDTRQGEKANSEVTGCGNEYNDQENVEAVVQDLGMEKVVTDHKAESRLEKKKRKKDKKPSTDSLISDVSLQDIGRSMATQKTAAPVAQPSLLPTKTLTPLQQSMRAKLASARFRHLNESLYTKPSQASLSIFAENPEMFEDYHRGFAQQVEVWPENPVDGYGPMIRTRGKARDKKFKNDKRARQQAYSADNGQRTAGPKPLPRDFKGNCTIADLGCGTASLAQRLQPNLQSLRLTVHSFDLSKPSGPNASLVTIADISALPLPDSSIDVAIFCLALMGTNWLDFIDEAYRILRWKGELWVAEIKSRFGRVTRSGKPPINSVGSLQKKDKKVKGKKKKEEEVAKEGVQGSDDEAELAEHVDGAQGKEGTDVSAFVEALRKRGFMLDGEPNAAIDLSNKMFVKMQFIKGTNPVKGKNVRIERVENGLKMGMKGKKFTTVSEEDNEDDAKDGMVLKPCLYKIR
ncbi:uncharacterized protein BDR25DRAFT_304363 [Lindgomyces ingoldianus]|uniref:Uncharacterized protein n=1 Tax=Lindgomyces ingoldianus TaxID=673940 RepID=A0ACB6QRL8_9PLEO|nr:uncharacterized protein BDR25DRAFT_304363 [Lindgomyces ingoldianus]KAF2469644.1 hypothetical protein BDR25DRAFT_304363 [Lindgomyces ingoldianus]